MKCTIKMAVATVFAFVMVIFGINTPAQRNNAVMVGHRGFSEYYPENTALAFEMAGQNNFGGAETDVRMTSDGVYVTNHNEDAEFADGTTLSVAEHTFKELTEKPLKNELTDGEVYLCTFKKYLQIMAEYDMVCFIELKGEYTSKQIKEIFALCKSEYKLEKCILQSFSIENLIEARELVPDLPLMLTFGEDDTDYEQCFEYGISIDANCKALTKEMVQEFHSRGLLVATYSANNELELSYCNCFGVDYIESNVYSSAKFRFKDFFDKETINPEWR